MPLVLGILVAAAVIFAVFAVAVGHGGSMTYFRPDWPGRPLPEDRTVRASDLAAARFSIAFRGYRMAEVDDALDRLALEIAQRDAKIESLTGRPFESEPPPPVFASTADGVSVEPTPGTPPPEDAVDEPFHTAYRPPAPPAVSPVDDEPSAER